MQQPLVRADLTGFSTWHGECVFRGMRYAPGHLAHTTGTLLWERGAALLVLAVGSAMALGVGLVGGPSLRFLVPMSGAIAAVVLLLGAPCLGRIRRQELSPRGYGAVRLAARIALVTLVSGFPALLFFGVGAAVKYGAGALALLVSFAV
ncbi:MAG: hypothetical protein AAGF12_11920 [Myxococcota bacterium]